MPRGPRGSRVTACDGYSAAGKNSNGVGSVYFVDELANVRVIDAGPEVLTAWQSALLDRLAPYTVLSCRKACRQIFAEAVKMGLIATNPFDLVHARPGPPTSGGPRRTRRPRASRSGRRRHAARRGSITSHQLPLHICAPIVRSRTPNDRRSARNGPSTHTSASRFRRLSPTDRCRSSCGSFEPVHDRRLREVHRATPCSHRSARCRTSGSDDDRRVRQAVLITMS